MKHIQAFPKKVFGEDRGMTLHQYYMAHAPITMEDAQGYVVAKTLNYRDGVPYADLMIAMKELREQYADAMCGVEG